MKNALKLLAVFVTIFTLSQVKNEAKATYAYGCHYTGSFTNYCYSGGYKVYRCSLWGYKGCYYYGGPQVN